MYRRRTIRGKASLTHSHPRHNLSPPRNAVVPAVDVAVHGIDGKRSARGTLPRLASLAVSACWALVRMLVVGEDSVDVGVGGGGETHKDRRGHDERAGSVLYVAQQLAVYVGFKSGHNSNFQQRTRKILSLSRN
jgi:hypothetical protein